MLYKYIRAYKCFKIKCYNLGYNSNMDIHTKYNESIESIMFLFISAFVLYLLFKFLETH